MLHYYALVLVSPPAFEPISLDEVKRQCRIEIEFEDEDFYIRGLIKAVREATEKVSNNLFMYQIWDLLLDRFPCGEILIRKRPVTEIGFIEYVDLNGNTQTLTDYQFSTGEFYATLKPAVGATWPAARCELNSVRIRFSAGWENTPEGIPEHMKQAMLLKIGHYYENREDTVIGINFQPLVDGYDALVALERVPKV
jgi:uncharacterized phiE125 gp8 family phage protein